MNNRFSAIQSFEDDFTFDAPVPSLSEVNEPASKPASTPLSPDEIPVAAKEKKPIFS